MQSTKRTLLAQTVREHNIYRWAANLLTDLADVRVEHKEQRAAPVTTRLVESHFRRYDPDASSSEWQGTHGGPNREWPRVTAGGVGEL